MDPANRIYFLARGILTGVLVVLLLSGCALFGRSSQEEEKTPAQLMSEGMDFFDGGYYESATKCFQELKDRYPYSQFAVKAELKMADALYERALYAEAYEAYVEFDRLHPNHPDIPYVMYQRGMCHFKQVTTIDRDQSHTFLAKEEFERLVKKFPTNEYAQRARLNIRKCYIYLADYELYVARFYYKKKHYRAAMERYRYVLKNYPDLGQYHEALEYLSRCKEKLAEEQNES